MEFKPTYLYIKQHSITGLKYFGKTTLDDPYSYFGSGKYWKHHIKKHGKEYIKTLWCLKFYNEEHIKEFALDFSERNNIVESDEWANIVPENGLDGGYNQKAIDVNKNRKGKEWKDIYSKEGLEKMIDTLPKFKEGGKKYQFQNIDANLHHEYCVSGGKSHVGKKESEQTKKNISNGIRKSIKFKEIKQSDIYRNKISKSVKNKWSDPNSIYNSDEYRIKLSDAQQRRSINRVEDMKVKFNSIEGQASSIADVCRLLNISFPTAKKYINILGLRFRM